MAGEEEILKDLNYTNYIYLFNNPYDINIAKAPLSGEENNPSVDLALQGLGIEQKLQVGNNFYNNNDPLVAETFLIKGIGATINNTTKVTPQPPSVDIIPKPAVFSDRDLEGDYPTLISSMGVTDGLRTGETANNIEYVAGNLTLHNTFLNNKFTNDYGYNPIKRHEFEINTSKGTVYYNFSDLKVESLKELTGSTGYQLIPQNLNDYGALDHSNKLLTAKQENQIITDSAGAYFKGPPVISNLLDGTSWSQGYGPVNENAWMSLLRDTFNITNEDLKLEPSDLNKNYGGWSYTQKFYFSMYVLNEKDPQKAQNKIIEYLCFISTPYGKVPKQPNGASAAQFQYSAPYGNFLKMVHNCSTKIGVPYDHQTVIKDGVDLKTVGVKNTTPKYESIYNYFDPQYEPQASSLVNQGILNENALTSVYDFIFRPYNVEFYDALLSNPQHSLLGTENKLNLSFINGFLDNLSVVYNNYIKSVQEAQGNFDEFANATPGSSQQLPEYTLNTWVSQFGENTGLDTSNIFTTEKSNFLAYMDLYKDFAIELKNSKNTSIPKWLEEIKSGIYFPERTMYLFNQAPEYKDSFPFLNTINIPQEKRGPLAKIFSKYNLLDGINTHAASLVVPNDSLNNQPAAAGTPEAIPKTYANFYGGLVNGYNSENFNMFNEVKLKTFKMHFINSSAKPTTAEGSNYLNPYDNYSNTYDDYSIVDLFLDTFQNIGTHTSKNVFIYSDKQVASTSDLLNILNMIKKQGLFKELESFITAGGMRTPREIQEGKLAHQETLMYEIAKYEIIDGQEEFIQSIFLPITNQEYLDYIDTQVIPFKDYFYKIFAHKVIVGTKYRPREMRFVPSTGGILDSISIDKGISLKILPKNSNQYADAVFPPWSLEFENEYDVVPYLQFVRVPYYNTPMVNIQTDALNYSRIEDYPPVPPQVQVIPYRNTKNKILFLLNSSAGEMKTTVVPISDTDLGLFDQCAIHQGVQLPSKDYLSEITFKGDDVAYSFIMYRMEKKPTSYREFSENKDAIAFNFDPGQTSFVDNILPNKDYYYTFKAIDVHGKHSNPTEVYKLRIISVNNSAPYVKIETFDPRDEAEKITDERLSTTKTFEKYLLFEINSKQNVVTYPDMELNEDGQGTGNYTTQPVEIDSNAFGKKYKLRITSKQTGRKIDINVDFKNPNNIINDK